MSYEDELKVIDKYKEGLSLEAVGKLFNVNFVTIRNILKGNKIERRKQGNKHKLFDEEFTKKIIDLYNGGLSQEKIAAQLHTSQTKISRLLQFNGIYSGVRRGELHHAWQGGKHTRNGYVFVSIKKESPYSSMAISNGYVMEHRLVMAQHLKRPLTKNETVHHINGDTKDNRIENLQLRHGKHGKHQVFVCCECGSHNVKSTNL
jgi:transcriptional regulator with XRE-family HTH domain